MKLKPWGCLIVLALLPARMVMADEVKADPDKLNVTWGGFIDTYYGYDFNVPPTIDRTLANGNVYSTTFDRSNEFNVNLAFIEAKISSDRVRGRFAVQTGTSVQTNYSGENNGLGIVKGALPAELIQEATVGYRLNEKFWVDAGIYPSHMGFESFISRDDWTYTRSLMGDFSPYYQSGVKFSYQFNPAFSGQLHILNGWQNIYENNQNKAVGLQLSTNTDTFTFTYNNCFSTEVGTLLRFFNDFICTFTLPSSLQVAASVDAGFQEKPAGGVSSWYAGALFEKLQVTPEFSMTLRGETYLDKDQVIVTTGNPGGFQVFGVSLNGDLQLTKALVWRNEVRLLASADSVFGSSNGPSTTDAFWVTSYGLSF